MLTVSDLSLRSGLPEAEVMRLVERAKRSLVPVRERVRVLDRGMEEYLNVTRYGVGPIQTDDYGSFEHFDFEVQDRWEKYSVLCYGELSDDFYPLFSSPTVPLRIRIDSGCETGQLFLDNTCDCRTQLLMAMERLYRMGPGLIISIPTQDGRGFGLPNKLATLRLQRDFKDPCDHNGRPRLNTVEAGDLLIPDGSKDIRSYAAVAAILAFLRIEKTHPILLMSNNLEKAAIFSDNGYEVQLDPLVAEATENTFHHLKAKQELLGHVGLIPSADSQRVAEERHVPR